MEESSTNGHGRANGLRPDGRPSTPAGATRGTPDAVAFRQALAVLRRHLLLVLAVTTAAVGAAVFLAMQEPPEYRASAVVRLSEGRKAVTGGLEDALQLTGPRTVDPVLSLVERLRSRQVAAVVVDTLGMRLKAITPTLSLRALEAVHVDSAARPDSIRLRFYEDELVARTGALTVRAHYGDTVRIGGVRFVVPARPDSESDPALLAVVPREQEVDRVLGKLELIPREATDVIDVAYSAADPIVAQQVVNTFIQSFQSINVRAAQEQSRLRHAFLSDQLRQTDSLLAKAQATLGAFRSREQLASSGDKLAAAQASILAVESQREQLVADRRSLGELPELLQRPSDSVSGEALRSLAFSPEMASNPVVERLSQQLHDYQFRLDSLVSGPWRRIPTDPDVLELKEIIASTKRELGRAVLSQVRSLDARIAALERLRVRSGASMQALPALQAEESRQAARVEALMTMGNQLRQEVQKAGLAEAVEVGDMQIVNLADVPYVSAWVTGWLKIGLGFLAGLILGGGAAYLLEAYDSSVRRPEDLDEVLQLSRLAVIPRVAVGRSSWDRLLHPLQPSNGRTHRHYHGHRGGISGLVRAFRGSGRHHRRRLLPDGLVTVAEPQSVGTEAFRMLRTSLVWSEAGQQLKTMLVTSVAPGEGKTLTAANLAVIFAREGARVLLVDGDLRRARLHRMFHMPRELGLSELIAEAGEGETIGGDYSAAIPILGADRVHGIIRKTGIERLFLLSAGTPNRAVEGFRELRVRQLLRELAGAFDLVIVDAPPVLATADAAILASMVDAVIFVVRIGRTDRRAIQHAYAQLVNVGARVVGMVLNDPQGELKQVGDYYYGYEYPEVRD